MPTYVKGNMWEAVKYNGLWTALVTTNSFVRKDGCLVMGRGAAKQMAERWSFVPRIAGHMIQRNVGHLGKYGVMLIPKELTDDVTLGLFQVKYGWMEDADLELIEYSVDVLCSMTVIRRNPIALNFPGIGNGKLKREDVLPIVDILPENVHIFEL